MLGLISWRCIVVEIIVKLAVLVIGIGCGFAAKDAAVARDFVWAIGYGLAAVGCIALAAGNYGGTGYKSRY
jgi:hypothetical protein